KAVLDRKSIGKPTPEIKIRLRDQRIVFLQGETVGSCLNAPAGQALHLFAGSIAYRAFAVLHYLLEHRGRLVTPPARKSFPSPCTVHRIMWWSPAPPHDPLQLGQSYPHLGSSVATTT